MQSDWNVVKRGWEAHVLGEAPNKFTDPVEALKTLKAFNTKSLEYTNTYGTVILQHRDPSA